MRVKITNAALSVPPLVETAEEVAGRCGVDVNWVLSRVGVRRRHVAVDRHVERLGAAAAREALASGPPPDLVINASLTPRQAIPDSSVFLLRELGLRGVPGFTIHGTCLSFLVALHTASTLISAGAYRRVLIVSAEIASVGRDWKHPESAALFGDGAAAAIVEPTPAGEPSELLGFAMETYPEGAEFTQIRGGGVVRHPNDADTRPEDHLFEMNGPAIYRLGRPLVGTLLARVYASAGLSGPEDVDLVVPHQASGLALASLRRYGFAKERVVNIIADYGNCIAASIPMALAHAHREGRLKRGDRVLVLGTGAGFSMAAAALRW